MDTISIVTGIYRSLPVKAYDVEIANMSVTVPQYSTVAFPVDEPETDTVSITGVLKDTEDKPLAGYTVEIRSRAPNSRYEQ